MTTTDDPPVAAASGFRWLRIIVAGVLLEFALVAVLVPIGIAFGEPFIEGSSTTGDYTVFFTAVPVACLVFGYVAGWLVVRRVSARFAMHGFLVGTVATVFYLIMTAAASGGLAPALAGYGPILFWGTQLLRILGSTAGAGFHAPRSR